MCADADNAHEGLVSKHSMKSAEIGPRDRVEKKSARVATLMVRAIDRCRRLMLFAFALGVEERSVLIEKSLEATFLELGVPPCAILVERSSALVEAHPERWVIAVHPSALEPGAEEVFLPRLAREARLLTQRFRHAQRLAKRVDPAEIARRVPIAFDIAGVASLIPA
jgi:hypothetical protein